MYWDELQSHCPIGACICGSKCKATKSIITAQEREFILHCLMGLDDKFSHARGHILLSDLIPSINKVFSLIIQEEEQLGNNSILESAAILLKNETGRNSEGGGKTNHKPLCTHCGKSDDTIDKCYHLMDSHLDSSLQQGEMLQIYLDSILFIMSVLNKRPVKPPSYLHFKNNVNT